MYPKEQIREFACRTGMLKMGRNGPDIAPNVIKASDLSRLLFKMFFSLNTAVAVKFECTSQCTSNVSESYSQSTWIYGVEWSLGMYILNKYLGSVPAGVG